MILVRFAPRPNVQPRSREGRVAASFAGIAWVHEHEHEVMRVEAEAVDDTAFGYGVIARLHKGAKALFIRRQFGDLHPEYSEGAVIGFVLESNVLPWLPTQD